MQARSIRRGPSSSSLSAEPQGAAQLTLTLDLHCRGLPPPTPCRSPGAPLLANCKQRLKLTLRDGCRGRGCGTQRGIRIVACVRHGSD
jgi:hypothetical protein